MHAYIQVLRNVWCASRFTAWEVACRAKSSAAMRVRTRAAAEQQQTQESDSAVDNHSSDLLSPMPSARPTNAGQRAVVARRDPASTDSGDALQSPCNAAEAAAIAQAEVSIQHAAGQCMKELRQLEGAGAMLPDVRETLTPLLRHIFNGGTRKWDAVEAEEGSVCAR